MEYLHPKKKTTHAKEQAENRKINAETKSDDNKLPTRTKLFTNYFTPVVITNNDLLPSRIRAVDSNRIVVFEMRNDTHQGTADVNTTRMRIT